MEWPRVYVNPSWQNDLFYISNPTSGLPKFSAKPPEWFQGWFVELNPGYKDQIAELLERTVQFQEMRVTTSSTVLNYTQRRIQALQGV